MDRPCLNDPGEFPGDDALARELGKAKAAWDAFLAMLRQDYPAFAAEWRFYPDGKSWLCKVTLKGKTVCWVSVWKRFFRVAFYLTPRAEPLVRCSGLDESLKEGFLHPAKEARLRPVAVEVCFASSLAAVRELIDIKLKAK